MIAGIVRRIQIRLRRWITHEGVEINQAIVNGVGAKPSVHGFSRGFVCRRVIAAAAERRDGRAVRANVARMRFVGELGVGTNQIRRQRRTAACACAADVVDALEHNQVTHATLIQHVVIKPVHCGRPESAEDCIAADTHVDDRNSSGERIAVETPSELIWPAIVTVRGRAAPVRDRIAERHDRSAGSFRQHVQARDDVPMRCCGRVGHVRRRRNIA